METKEELEKQYSPSAWSHRFGRDEVVQMHIKVLTERSDMAKLTIEHESGVSYGLSEKEKLDIFAANTLPGDVPILVYIHGGYWQQLSREMSSFLVPPLAKAGAVVVAVGYNLAPQASMDEIVTEVTKAVTFVLNMARRRGSSGVYLCGHSAGAHLAAMMLHQDWMFNCMCSDSLIRGAVLVSGVFDIRPIVQTYVNDPLKMTEEVAWKNSPMKYVQEIAQRSRNRKIMIAFGDHDSPAFQRQSTEFNTSLVSQGLQTSMVVVPNADHFNVIEDLSDPDNILTQEVLRMMGLDIDFVLQGMQNAGIS